MSNHTTDTFHLELTAPAAQAIREALILAHLRSEEAAKRIESRYPTLQDIPPAFRTDLRDLEAERVRYRAALLQLNEATGRKVTEPEPERPFLDLSADYCRIGEDVYRADMPPVKAAVDRLMHALAGQGEPWWMHYTEEPNAGTFS